jgi:hypothetical protein
MILKQTSSVAYLVFLLLWPLQAIQPVALPAFQVTGLDATSISSDKLTTSTQWLILYLQADCHSCETALQLIKQTDQHPNLPKSLVIIGGMTLPQLRALAQKYPDLSSAIWTADTSRTAFKLLQLPGTPTVLGIKADVHLFDGICPWAGSIVF